MQKESYNPWCFNFLPCHPRDHRSLWRLASGWQQSHTSFRLRGHCLRIPSGHSSQTLVRVPCGTVVVPVLTQAWSCVCRDRGVLWELHTMLGTWLQKSPKKPCASAVILKRERKLPGTPYGVHTLGEAARSQADWVWIPALSLLRDPKRVTWLSEPYFPYLWIEHNGARLSGLLWRPKELKFIKYLEQCLAHGTNYISVCQIHILFKSHPIEDASKP